MNKTSKSIKKNIPLSILFFLTFFFCVHAFAKPAAEWLPKNLDIEQMRGSQSIKTFTLKPNQDGQDVAVRVGSKLEPWVTVSPGSIKDLQKGQDLEVTVVINVPPNAETGIYNGVIQLREKNPGQQQDTIAKPLPIKIQVTEKIAGNLPPDPKKKGMRTLLGIDSDNDGVRDDIQRYIYFTYPDDEKIRMALTQIALQWQGLLAQANDLEAAYNHATKMMRHGECLYYLKGRASLNMDASLQAEVLNTKERSIAYITYSDSLGGTNMRSAPLKEWKNSCAFDVDAIGVNQ